MKKYEVGDLLYRVRETNNILNRKKISKEIDGETWHRYDKPLREYVVETYEILGVLEKNLFGEWSDTDDYELDTQYFVHNLGGKIPDTFVSELDGIRLFINKDEAIAYANLLQTQENIKD